LKASRHNYLEPKAVGYIVQPDGWWVVFRVTQQAIDSGQDIFPFSPIGRHVFVNKNFKSGVLHSWADLKDPEMIPIPIPAQKPN
jgi:hypothetical protein